MTVSADRSGIFAIGNEIAVHRMGYGAMQITGNGVWGPPRDKAEALRVLRRLPELGVDFIDTADSYGPDVSERLIREALHPYEGILVATKAGFVRSGPHMWRINCRPEHLIDAAHRSREKLGVERIGLWQLHRIDSRVPRDEQFAAIRQLLDQGVIRHAGLSEVSVEEIKAASKVFPVATVQNAYNLADRGSDDVVDYCAANGIGFIPYYPLGDGSLARAGGALDRLARAKGATAGQVALAWLLKRSPVMLPIPGTSSLAHLEENVAASAIALSDEEFAGLDRRR
ncbi:MAG: aldo/keto reductase [Alphaproteobacteria bacterium]|nr:aldo/keto reductase [Alphaproteobacteria bacterium]